MGRKLLARSCNRDLTYIKIWGDFAGNRLYFFAPSKKSTTFVLAIKRIALVFSLG